MLVGLVGISNVRALLARTAVGLVGVERPRGGARDPTWDFDALAGDPMWDFDALACDPTWDFDSCVWSHRERFYFGDVDFGLTEIFGAMTAWSRASSRSLTRREELRCARRSIVEIKKIDA